MSRISPRLGREAWGGSRKSPNWKKGHLVAVQGSLVELGIQVEGSLAGGSPVQGSHLHLKGVMIGQIRP